MPPQNFNFEDHAKVVSRTNIRISWVWLFPILALLGAGWFFWAEWKSNGPIIEVEFHEAPGIQANKTLLFYRGVAAGKVIDVRLDDHLSKAIVKIRLKAFASLLAQAGTLYWIDQPVISLAQTSGLTSIIQGNSIQARLGDGPRTNHFVGMEKMPLHPLEPPGLVLKLVASEIPFLEEGSPIIYRGTTIGGVMRKGLDEQGQAFVVAAIQKQYVHLIHSNSRFWNVPATSFNIGPNGIQFELLNLKGMFLGAVAIDTFEVPGERPKSGVEYTLYANESEARSENEGVSVVLNAKEIPTIYVDAPVLYRGVIVGKVLKKEFNSRNEPLLTLLIKKEFRSTLRQNTTFWRVPATSIQAGPGVIKVDVSSLQALLQGGIAFDVLGSEGPIASEGSLFHLFPNEQLAHLSPEPLHMTFDEGQGLLAGQTQLRYLGIPVGLVEEVKVLNHKVEVTAYLTPGHDFLRKPDTTYNIIRSKLGLDGISGLETLVSGVYIDCDRPKKSTRPLTHFFNRVFKKK